MDNTVEFMDEPEAFTFPQVKPMYSKLLNKTGRKPLKPLKPFRLLEEIKNNEPPNIENKAQEDEDQSHSVNSLSGDLNPPYKIESSSHLGHRKVVDERSYSDVMTPLPTKLQTYSSVKHSVLVKRILKTPASHSNENCYVKDSKHYQCTTDFEMQPKLNGKDTKLNCENRDSKDERVLKDILNYDLGSEKSADELKTARDSKYIINGNKSIFLKPSVVYHKETGVLEARKSPKATNRMTPAIELNKNSRSCSTNVRYRNGSRDFDEKPRQILFKEAESENQEINHNPSIFNVLEHSVLNINKVQYRILSKLGHGGSSQVYQVLDNKTSSLLAVKCVNLAEADEATAKGYLKEIEMLSKLQSSNRVIKLLDHEYVKQEQVLYVVMEKGDTDLSTLLKLMSKSGDVSLPMIIYYWTEMLHAVKEIHNHGIVHADLKPANFLLVCGRLKLIDFGIASSIQNDATSVFKSTMHGTCNYMSPEAIQDPGDSSRTKVGYKSDVWSLGCILYNMLYRKTPFQQITNNLKKLQIIANPSHRIEFPRVEKCPPPLMDALKRCLTYDAKKRPTVAELLAIDYYWPGN